MEACATGGAAVAFTAFESCGESKNLSRAALDAAAPGYLRRHLRSARPARPRRRSRATTAHRGDARWLIRRFPWPPSREFQKLTPALAFEARIL